MATADRYLRTGTTVPQIYHGTLKMLVEAEKDTRRNSARFPGTHSLFAVREGTWNLIRVYEDGQLTWVYSRES
jgi:hypothetical protein